MDTIISPWVFYFMELASGVNIFCTTFGVLGLIGAISCAIPYYLEKSDRYGDEEVVKTFKSIVKVCLLVGVILLVIATICPSQETISKMVIAQNVTYDRLETVTDTVETVYNDIMELFTSNE